MRLRRQARAQVGLNKGEAHHALKNALHLGHAVEARRREGLDTPAHLFAQPFGWQVADAQHEAVTEHGADGR